MESLKILIAAGVLILASSALIGCTPSGNVSEVGIERIEAAQEMKKNVELQLAEVEGEDDVVVQMLLNNPENRPITSVQAWLTYNPELLKGVSINTSRSAFELTAPYDNDFDHETGLMMLGRSTSTPIEDEQIMIAEVHFTRVSEGVAMIEAYDFKQDLVGHTSANMMFNEAPVNVLLKPESPLLIIK
jgi:hypothetical protein